MTDRIFTDIRISHKSIEDKQEYERKLADALKKNGYRNRVDWIQDMYRKLVNDK